MNQHDRQGWTVVAALFATLFLIWGPINASSVFFIPVVKHFGWSRALFSSLVAAAPLAAGISSPLVGSMIDRFGERVIMMAGALLVGLSFAALARADSAIAFLAIFVVLGLGVTSSTIIPTAIVLTRRFREQRGRALGIAFAGIPLGGTGITILASRVVARAGFRAGYLAMALPIFFVVIPLLAIFMRPQGELKDAGDVRAAAPNAPGLDVGEAIRTRSFWMLAIGEVMFATAGVGLRVHLVPILTAFGYSPTVAAEIFSAIFIFSAIGTLAVGNVADRLGGRATLSLAYLGAAAGIVVLFGAGHGIIAALFVVMFGLVRETPPALMPLAVTESLGPKRLGTLLGFLALSNTIGFAVGPVIAGRIFDRTGSYAGALALFVAFGIAASLAMRATLPLGEEQERAAAGATAAA